MDACVVGLRAEVLEGLSIGSWSRYRGDSAGPCATCRASWTILAGAGRIWVGGGGKQALSRSVRRSVFWSGTVY